MVNRITDPTFPLPATAVQSKGHTFIFFVYKFPYIDYEPIATLSGEVSSVWIVRPSVCPSACPFFRFSLLRPAYKQSAIFKDWMVIQ